MVVGPLKQHSETGRCDRTHTHTIAPLCLAERHDAEAHEALLWVGGVLALLANVEQDSASSEMLNVTCGVGYVGYKKTQLLNRH